MFVTTQWQLLDPISAVVFDCDGTLTTIEGIDELAKHRGVYSEVQFLTAQAMGQTGINPELYQKRLELVCPTKQQVLALGEHYFTQRVPHITDVIQVFAHLHKSVYIISAGLYPAVAAFGEMLQIPRENIFAVDIQFDMHDHFSSYDVKSPLLHNHGKRDIIAHLKTLHKEILYVGDGLNDYATAEIVQRFVGYGGVFYRENIAKLCEHYIHSLSMAPLLPLALTPAEYKKLTPKEQALYQLGVRQLMKATS